MRASRLGQGHRGGGDLETRAPRTLVEMLDRAATCSGPRGITFLDRRGRMGERRCYAPIVASCRLLAARLATLGLRPKEPVLLALPSSFELVESWFGCLLLGAWPVAVAPPGSMGTAEYHLRKLEAVIPRFGVQRIICAPSMIEEARRQGHDRLAEFCVTPAEIAAQVPHAGFSPAAAEPEETAFLQLTSGSTGRQRAVMISHRAAVWNPLGIDEALAAPHGSRPAAWPMVGVSWLPFHHDMGLVGCLFYAMAAGVDASFLTPRAFLGRPHLWLQLLGAHPHTGTTAPNFAYQACVERVRPEQIQGLDLRGWRAALIGAEMIRAETLDAFAEKFAPFGFAATSFRPCYGLAEATLAVTLDRRGEGIRTRTLPGEELSGRAPRRVVGLGPPLQGMRLQIRAPDGSALGEDRIGEVWVGGPSVFSGYYRDAEATAESLVDGWLRTGDLGFQAAGELWLTGRSKDLIILNGLNVMPHELEWLAEAVGGLRCGAFAEERATGEVVVLVVETARDAAGLGELEHEIRSRIGRDLGVPLADVVFVARGKIPNTTSGKIQHALLRQRYLAGELERLGQAESSAGISGEGIPGEGRHDGQSD